jgi:murein L,D-transpeptidase YcbB/YkuD
VVDSKTWRQLSVPLSERVNQLALTLERWRWVPHTFKEPPVVVNIPEFRVRAYDEQLHVVLSMPVIVGGSAGRRSPVLQASMTQVIFYPFWNVPRKIQMHEIAPHVARNPAYLSTHDYELVNSQGTVAHLSGVAALHAILSGSIRVRQRPGDLNALGAIKFVFPNAFDVYMHGTPEQKLFQQDRRDFSHGCIRVEEPNALALWVLHHESGWTAERIADAVANPETLTVRLSRPIPVLIVYGTGFAAEDGSVRFYDDVYHYDAVLTAILANLSAARRSADQTPW